MHKIYITKLLIFCGLLSAVGLTLAQSAVTPRHYEYVLYLRASYTPAAINEAVSKVRPSLVHHRLSDPKTLRTWNGEGQIPSAFEQRDVDKNILEEATIFDTGEPLREVLGATRAKSTTSLAVMIGVPQKLNVPAYIEALQFTIDIANALHAPAFRDSETKELRRTRALSERLTEGVRDNSERISITNLPRMVIMGGMTAYERLGGGATRTWGMRKMGLPDLFLADWVPGPDETWLFDVVGSLMIAGKVNPLPGTTFNVRASDPEVSKALYGNARPGAVAPLRFVAIAPNLAGSKDVLAIEFPGPAKSHLYERQMIFVDALLPSQYLVLGANRAQELSLAIARAKSQLNSLRARFSSLQKIGTRIFVAARMDMAVKDLARIRKNSDWVNWMEVVSWTSGERMRLRDWKGDPRSSGTVIRYNPPIRVGGEEFVYQESLVEEGLVEDILLIDKSGKVTGGEVTKLLSQFAVETVDGKPR